MRNSSICAFATTAIASMMAFSCPVHSVIRVSDEPVTIIREGDSQLDRPEGVVFSRDGRYIATANSLVNTVTFYKRVGDDGAVFEPVPAFSIEGPDSQLNYPHDIAFSPDSRRLAVANRMGNSITIYAKDETGEAFLSTPVAVIKGMSSKVQSPDSVRYSPVDNVIAVANLHRSTITLYHYAGDEYDKRPFQTISGTSHTLKVPDSIDFSFDGELMAATSHDTNSVVIYQRLPGKGGRYTSEPVEIIKGKETNFTCPHSVSFHPTKDYLIVSSAQGLKNVNIFKKVSDAFPRYEHTPSIAMEIIEMYEESTLYLLEQLKQEGGCKGVYFSPDGKSFAVTQNLCADLLKLPYSVGALLVYTFEDVDAEP